MLRFSNIGVGVFLFVRTSNENEEEHTREEGGRDRIKEEREETTWIMTVYKNHSTSLPYYGVNLGGTEEDKISPVRFCCARAPNLRT